MGGLNVPQNCVCFSEIPLDRLDRLVERRGSQYGIGFTQEFIARVGGGRVWYVDKDTELNASVWELLQLGSRPQLDQSHPVWRIAPFIDFPGAYADTEYRFEWEREWRVPAEVPFQPLDAAFLFIPGELHEAARRFFENARRENGGPAYNCPFVDPLWADDEIQNALASTGRGA